MLEAVRKYPIGIQTFSELIRGGYLYVDKTDLIWQMAHYSKFVFLSRPRRFGKSLLTSTLESYFKGEKELFEGLKMMDMEQEWTAHPVLHIDLTNVSLLPKFSAICGITEEELYTVLLPDIERLATHYDCTADEMKQMLKARYDGYHFADKSADIYNPYSLLSAFANEKIANYWFETGTPTFLIQMMKKYKYDITSMDGIESTDYAINRPTEAMSTIVPLLYQSGYLTIKDYDREGEIYTLGIPNQEVRIGYADGLLPTYSGLEGETVQAGFAVKFWRALKTGDIDKAMREMQAYLAGIPYVAIYLIFSMLNVYVRTQVKCAGGRVDMVVWMPYAIYVFELKAGDTAQNALKQIDDKGYAIPYQTDGRRVVKVGVSMNAETRTVENWETDI